MYLCIFIYIYIPMRLRIHICMYVYISIYIYVYVLIHTRMVCVWPFHSVSDKRGFECVSAVYFESSVHSYVFYFVRPKSPGYQPVITFLDIKNENVTNHIWFVAPIKRVGARSNIILAFFQFIQNALHLISVVFFLSFFLLVAAICRVCCRILFEALPSSYPENPAGVEPVSWNQADMVIQ